MLSIKGTVRDNLSGSELYITPLKGRYRSSHRRCSIKKGVLENFAKFTGKHLWFEKFSRTTFFYRAVLDDCFWLFHATFPKWGTANSVWTTLDEYSVSRNTDLRNTVQIYHFFTLFAARSSHQRRDVLWKKVFLNFIGKHMCCLESLFNKVAAWNLFWRISANDCFCATLVLP